MDGERSARGVLERPMQIEALPLPGEISPDLSFNAEISEPDTEVSSSPSEATIDDPIGGETDPEASL